MDKFSDNMKTAMNETRLYSVNQYLYIDAVTPSNNMQLYRYSYIL